MEQQEKERQKQGDNKKQKSDIKKHKLQDAVNKRMINADAKLKEVFGKMQVSMFEMAGLIGKHLK